MWLLFASLLFLTATGISIYLLGRLAGLKKDPHVYSLMTLLILTAMITSSTLLFILSRTPQQVQIFLSISIFARIEIGFGLLLTYLVLMIFIPRRGKWTGKFKLLTRTRGNILILSGIPIFLLPIILGLLFPFPARLIVASEWGWWYRLTPSQEELYGLIQILLLISFVIITFLLLTNKISTSRGFIRQEYLIAREFVLLPVLLALFHVMLNIVLLMTGNEHLKPINEAAMFLFGLIALHHVFFVKHSSYLHVKYLLPRFFELMGSHAPPLAIIDLENQVFITSTRHFKRITHYPYEGHQEITKGLFTFLKTTQKTYHHDKRVITYDEFFTVNQNNYLVKLAKIPQLELYLLMLTDITQLKNLNEKLQEYVSGFNLFLSTAFHELGNSLQPILGFVEILKEEISEQASTNPLILESLEIIERNAFRMKELLQLFRLIGKNQANFLDVNLEVINLTLLIKNLHRDYWSQAKSKNISLHVKLPEKKVFVLGDPVYLPIVLVNVLSNAIKYTPSGGQIVVTLQETPDELESESMKNTMVCLEISDTGIGIENDEKEVILNPFKRGKVSKSAFSMGLGLYVTNEIIKKHDGHLEILSEGKNKGTTVRIYLIRAYYEDFAFDTKNEDLPSKS